MANDLERVEREIRACWDGHDHQGAATLVIEHYGDEILGFLVARMRSESDAAEAFSMFAEDLWKGLPTFEWRCSMRGWAYTLARNAATRYATSPHNRVERNLTLSKHARLSELLDRMRSATRAHMRTDVKDRMRALRDQLEPDDQTLLILRVDRNLPWRELAMVMHEGPEPLADEDVDKATVRLRKRFERLKARLKELARAEGLI